MASGSEELAFVSRGGLKLEHALREFDVDTRGLWCVDLGCSTGGFTDCLLQRGASRVFAVDTAYGEFAWKLRTDERVVLFERSNALHLEPPDEIDRRGGVDLAVIDLGWTRQSMALPAARRWLAATGRIVTLVKPHYEVDQRDLGSGGRLDDAEAEAVAARAVDAAAGDCGMRVAGLTQSPIRGGATKRAKRRGGGNLEWLALLELDESEA